MDDNEQLEIDLLETKRCIFRSFESINSLFFLDNEKTKIKAAFDMAFRHKLSTSLIVVGGSAGNSIQLIKSVLASYKNDFFQATSLNTDSRFDTSKNYVAKVNGSLQVSDQEALEDLANQFFVRTEKESASSLFVEDLEDHFRQCRLDGIPAIIVIEDFHVFTKKKRQTLIYTLLDLMHKKELLFMIVGITDHADVETTLEKRVLSRLNTQYVFMSRPTGADICEYLYNVCTLPIEENNIQNANICDTAKLSNQPDLSNISTQFIREFNQSVAKLFGKYIDNTPSVQQQHNDTLTMTDTTGTTTAVDSSSNSNHNITDTSMIETTEANEDNNHSNIVPKKKAFLPGDEWQLVSMHCEWGRDLSYFIKVGLMLVSMLSLEQPFLSSAKLHEVLAEQEPESVEEVVAGLSSLELHLFISVLHIHGNAQKGSNSNIANTTGSMLMLVNKVLAVCDMLTEVLKQKMMPKCRIVQALANLAQKGLIFMTNITPGKHTLPAGALSLGVPGADTNSNGSSSSNSLHSITAQTVVVLNVPYAQAVDAFRVKKSRSGESSSGGMGELYVGRPRCVVQVTERLRKAVLEPVVNIVYQQSHGQTAGVGVGTTTQQQQQQQTSTLSLSSHQAILDAQKHSFQAYDTSS